MKQINVVITAGGTNEQVDEVRKITNMSTGALGVMFAKEVVQQLGDMLGTLYYICSKHAKQPQPIEGKNITILHAESAQQLQDTIETTLKTDSIHYFIHSAAISDYTTDYVTNTSNLTARIERAVHSYLQRLHHSPHGEPFSRYDLEEVIQSAITQPMEAKMDNRSKISSQTEDLIVVMKQTEKIIAKIKEWSPQTFLVGFKLLNGVSEETLFDTAFRLLRKNRCNLVLANDLTHIRNGTHIGMLVYPEKKSEQLIGKEVIAKELVTTMLKRGETRYPKSIQNKTHHTMPDDLFHTFKQTGEILYKQNLLPIVEGGTYGNMSVKNEHAFYITGRNVQKGHLTKDILVEIEQVKAIPLEESDSVFAEITYNGNVKPSIDTGIHHFIYQHTQHKAILHVHTNQIFEGYPLTDYNYACGTEQEMKSILAPIMENPTETIVQMNKHGLIIMGQTLEECLDRLHHLVNQTLNIDPIQPSLDQEVWQEWTTHMGEVGETDLTYDFYNPKDYYVIKEGNEKLGIVFVKPEKDHLAFALYSLESVRGKGKNVATKVLACLTTIAKTKQINQLHLITKKECGVQDFYERKHQFTLISENNFIKMKKSINE